MKARDIKPFGLRLVPALKNIAQEKAKQNKRSLNSEIIALIEDGLKWREQIQEKLRA